VIYSILTIFITAYLGICLAVLFFQHFFFFRPEILAHHFKYQYPFPFEELNFDMEDGGKINAIHFKVPNSRGVVYYLKGNSRSIKGWGKFAKDFVSNGYDFFMMDYRGFGKSRGKRSQEKLFSDAQYLYLWLRDHYNEKDIIVYGRSFGTGIAARVASWNKPRILILDSPYFSFLYNAKRYAFILPLKWLLRYDLRTDQYLKTITCPVHIIHGNKDRLISYSQSEKLKALYPDKIELHTIEGGRHNNLPDFPIFFELLYDILYIPPSSNFLNEGGPRLTKNNP
jgi:alpha-beta hydrolase superfamily lysophospholipase